ncbi:MAG: galactose mutarotase [Clostridia bacterium]|nr:galactose mutarotase [Clostridia bacterium]
MSIEKKRFGKTTDGKDVYSYTIANKNGMRAVVLSYGGALQALYVPDKKGKARDVLIGFDDMDGFETRCNYQGVLVGRYCNRIAGGTFTVGSKTYDVTRNEKNVTCLHGGGEFSRAVWQVRVLTENAIELQYVSPDGAEGFPGEMQTTVVYTLTDDNELILDYKARCTADSYINLTNHAYFNLGGSGSGDILPTELYIRASHYLPTDEDSIPTGEIRPVEGTAFDFRDAKPIGRDIGMDDAQLRMCRGYDHNYCLDAGNGAAAEAYCPASGIRMQMFTDLPGVQLYTGNFLNGAAGKKGRPMDRHAGFCLETQYYPDTPHRPEFPSCLYHAGEVYTSRTSFKFV